MINHLDSDATADGSAADQRESNPLSVELARLDKLLAAHLVALRGRGRSSLGEAVGGAVIEDGEAEGLVSELYEIHDNPSGDSFYTDYQWTSPLPGLEYARQVFGLSPVERDVLMLATAVEIDSRYARLVAFLNDHVQMTRPTLGLAMAVLMPEQDRLRTAFLQRFISDSPIRRFGLLELEGNGPLANRALCVPQSFWPQLVGMNAEHRFAIRPNVIERHDLVICAELSAQIDSIAIWIRTQRRCEELIIVAGEAGSGRDTVAELVAGQLAHVSLIVDARHDELVANIKEIARESLWHNAAVIVKHAHVLPVQFHAQLQQRLTAPIVYVTEYPHDSTLLDHTFRRCFVVAVPVLDTSTRATLWELLSRRHTLQLDVSALASRFGFGPGKIDKALTMAASVGDPGDYDGLQANVAKICHKIQRANFKDLAQKLPCPFEASDIVLPDKTCRELDLICTWARHGHRLFADNGVGHSLHTGKGLVCLFSGPPGTGKTMAAQIIARRIDFEIYRIDLSQVVNKYVGETEKNLAKVFDEAQRSKVILFFDEAETLYGDRSEVRTAQDRFANIEIGYLLQRIETFEGVAVLATNLQKNLDEAFLRRLNVTADFPIPGPEERRLIWQKLLPQCPQRQDDVDIDLLSRQFKIAGGDIRNAIFSALLLSAEAEAPLGMAHLVRGLWRELQKSGRVVDTAQFGAWRELVNPRATTRL